MHSFVKMHSFVAAVTGWSQSSGNAKITIEKPPS
jgi:hypothetical protein